jgi:tetratricopeptide (TPR) repeat protein
MPVLQGRRRHLAWIAGLLTILAGGGAGFWWRESRGAPRLVVQARSAYSRGDWDGTARLARGRLKEAPDDEEALCLAARALARQDRDPAAIATYSRVELKRMTAEDYFLLGRALSRTGQDDLALKSLEAARAADPDRPEMLDELARVDFRRDRHAAAEAIAERLARLPAWEARAQLMLGATRAARRDAAGAARALRRAFELDPQGRAAAPQPARPLRMLLVRTLLQTGQPAEARRVLEALASGSESEPGPDPEASWLLSRCFLQEQAWGPAAAALERAGSYRADYPIEPEPAPFVGAARCGSCHPAIHRSVLASRHSTTFARPRDPRALALPEQPFPDPADPRVQHHFQAAEGGIRVEARVGEQVFRALARYAFGSPDHYVTLVGPDDAGRSRMMRISGYRSPRGSGVDVSNGIPRHPADPIDFLGNAMEPGDGERRCLGCHTTNLHAIEVQAGPEAADHSIGCEACHGPGGHHVLARQADFDDPAIVAPRQATARTINQVCERCHALGHIESFTGAVGDVSWLRFQSTTLYRSRCYTGSGEQLHCATCHDPHRNAETSASFYEARCLTCHDPARSRNPCPVNPATGCIACHMPRTWVPGTHAFKSDHNIRVHAGR